MTQNLTTNTTITTTGIETTMIPTTTPEVTTATTITPTAEPTIREMLMARGRLGHARMYLWDLENGSDFTRMVDARGSQFNVSRARWIEIILKIAGETRTLLPDDTMIVLDRLKAACPEVVIPEDINPQALAL